MGRKRSKLRAYASHVSTLWPYEWTPNDIYGYLCSTRSPMTSRKINLYQNCTEGSSQGCHILKDLSLWNEFLWVWHMELKEEVPGELGIHILRGARPDFAIDAQTTYALVLLHWLLKEHRCLKSLKIQSLLVERFPKLLLDAIHVNVGLVSLELLGVEKVGRDFDNQSDNCYVQGFLTAIGSLVRLKELKLKDVILSKDAFAVLGAAFENLSLRSFAYGRSQSFAMLGGPMPPETALLLMESLKRSKTLRELDIDICCLQDGSGAMFAEYLEGNDRLEKLTIHRLSLPWSSLGELAPVLGVLAENKVLQKFKLIANSVYELKRNQLSGTVGMDRFLHSSLVVKHMLEREDATVPYVIRNNSTLLELEAGNLIIKDIKPFAEAVCVNKTMQKLSLNWFGLSLCDTKEFCSALAENQSLEVVTMNDISEHLVESVYKVLKETGTEQRVRLAGIIRTASVLHRTLENCCELKEVCYCAAFPETAASDGESLDDRIYDDRIYDDNPEDDNNSAVDDNEHGSDNIGDCDNCVHDDDDHDQSDGNVPKDDCGEADENRRDDGNIPPADDWQAHGDTSSNDSDSFNFDFGGYDFDVGGYGFHDDFDDMLGYYHDDEDYENFENYDNPDNYYDSDNDSYYGYEDDDSETDSFFEFGMGVLRDVEEVAPEIPAFRCLSMCSHLETLHIIVNERMDEQRAGLLAQFLSSTKTLRCAILSFPTTESATQALLDGLSSNTSVSTLELGFWHFKRRHAEDFTQLLMNSKTLNHLSLHDTRTKMILQGLASYISGNKFLVSISVDDGGSFTKKSWMFQIRDILRRNSSLLQCAAHFVMGNHGKRYGEAFEQMFRSRALLKKVQELANETESSALARIWSGKRYLDVNFLAVAAVVKNTVVCDKGDGRRIWLDQIGEDNWLRVRSYLKLTDIKENPEPQALQASKRKRRRHGRRRKP